MSIARVYICSNSCTCLFTVNEHVIHVVASHVDVFACIMKLRLFTTPILRPHSPPMTCTTTQMNKHKAGSLNDAGHCLGPSVSLSYYY